MIGDTVTTKQTDLTTRKEYSELNQFKLLQIMPAEGTLAVYQRHDHTSFDVTVADFWASKLDMLGLAKVKTRYYVTEWTANQDPKRSEHMQAVCVNRVVGVHLRDGFFDVCETACNFVAYFKPEPTESPEAQRIAIAEMVGVKPSQRVTVMLPSDTSPVEVAYPEQTP